MMMEYSFNLHDLAISVEKAVEDVLKEGSRTPDIFEEGFQKVSCSQMGDLIVKKLGG